MPHASVILLTAAVSMGFFHVLLGPDHYLPFIVIAKARRWSLLKTSLVTVLCGIGHVGSSILIGLMGVRWGISLKKLEVFESVRGEWAAWGLIAFGLAYFIYGLRKALRARFETKGPGPVKFSRLVPWSLFVVFVFGPCEPLIPIFMYPSMRYDLAAALLATGVFSFMTVMTMLGIVLTSVFGIGSLPEVFKGMNRYGHALAGLTVILCGLGVQFLGL